jgi:hypothetical protein
MLTFALTGCGVTINNPALGGSIPSPGSPGPANSSGPLHGHVGGELWSVSASNVQLYAVGTQGVGSASTPLLAKPVETDSDGDFTIVENYACSSPASQLYLLATGGNPGLASGTNNHALSLMAMLGPCSALSSTTIYPVNEVTTVGSVWPLFSYMISATQLGSVPSDASFAAATARIGQLINPIKAVSPGTGIPSGYAVQTAKLYTLADDLHACVASSGGTAGDGSACGQLFSLVTSQAGTPPTDTVDAALHLAQANQLSVDGLFQFLPAEAPFQPVLSGAPTDWDLDLVQIPVVPIFEPAAGAYAPGQQITLSSGTPRATIRYTLDGSIPGPNSTVYSAPLTLSSSETVRAIAVTDDVSSATSSATFTVNAVVNAVVNVSLTPLQATLSPSQSQQFTANVTGTSNTSVIWKVNPPVGTISATGLYTAPGSIVSLQNVIVTATSNADPTKAASANVSITPAGNAYVTYYVDNVDGSDSNDGTSTATPFATVAKVNTLALTPGQTVAFKSGDVWHEMLTVSHSGSPGTPINYLSYGTGAQPVIDASDTVTGWTQGGGSSSIGLPSYVWSHPQPANPLLINFAGQVGAPVASGADISAAKQFAWNGSTLYVYSNSDPTSVVEVAVRTSALTSPGASYITVSNLELRGGTDIAYCGAANPCANWDFESNTFDSGYGMGLRWLLNKGVNGGGLTVNNNTFRGTGASGIGLSNGGPSMGDLITNNTMTDLCKIYVAGSSEHAFCDAINLFSQTETDGGGQILNNTISEVGLTSGAAYGGGIHPDTVVNWDIEHNVVSDTNYPGISLEKGSGSIARYNLLINAGQYQYFSGLFIRAGDGLSVSNMLAEYNTVVGGYWACALLIYQNSGAVTATNITISRNICAGSMSGTQFWLDPGYAGAGNSFMNNGFGVAAANFVSAGNVTYSNYGLLPSPIVDSVAGDPQFVSPATGNYNLQPTSPDLMIGAFPQL